MSQNPNWKASYTLYVLGIMIVIPVFVMRIAHQSRIAAWLGTLILLILLTMLLGRGVTGFWRGALIDPRNVMSLSRFQMMLWTLLVLSAYLAGTLSNLALGMSDPLAVSIPTELWVLMGISTVSLVGSPLILRTKTDQPPDPKQLDTTKRLLEQQGTPADQVDNVGHVLVNKDPRLARWSDIVTGEEVGNAAQLDWSRIQMLYFTLTVLVIYGIALGHAFSSAPFGFPAFDSTMLPLLAISHAGYLGFKAISHTGSQKT